MKVFTGRVVSTKMAKTATVLVSRTVAHPVYGKQVKRTKKYHLHDELGAKVGDNVRFVAARPVSKLKKWKVIEIVESQKAQKGEKKAQRKPR